jgi:hypothetical protein
LSSLGLKRSEGSEVRGQRSEGSVQRNMSKYSAVSADR